FYLSKALVPLKLSFIYPQWNLDPRNWLLWLSFVGMVVTTVGLIYKRQNYFYRALLFAWLFFLLALAPSLGFVDVGYMRYSLVADHYQHIALIAIVAILAAIYAGIRVKTISATVRRALLAGLIAGLALIAFGRATRMADPEALYTKTLESNPE